MSGSLLCRLAKVNNFNQGVINVPVAGGIVGREVNPQHPLLSARDTRSMSHLNPVSKMTKQQRAQEIFEKLQAGTWWPFDQIPEDLVPFIAKLYKQNKVNANTSTKGEVAINGMGVKFSRTAKTALAV